MDLASPEEYDDPGVSDGESLGDEIDLKHESSPTSPTATHHASGGKGGLSSKSSAHSQKRRRVTRACDECRRKKIKCDGKQPCTHCTVYSYECTYDQPSNRRRNPAPQYVENLEHRVHRAETLLHILIPNLDLNDPGIDAAVQQGWIPGAPGKGNPVQPSAQSQRSASLTEPDPENQTDTKLESMVRATAHIDMDEAGNWDYHGHSSGLSFVRRMREQLGDLMGPETICTPFVKNRPMSGVLDSPKSIAESPLTGDSASTSDLPPKHIAQELCICAVEDAAALLRVVHQPTFWKSFERLYNIPPEQYTNEDQKFLPLFHSSIALGHLFGRDEQSRVNQDGYENAIQQGFVHFRAARQMLDIADCRDLMSIQAVMMMIIFLQSSAKLSQCYAYVGVALRSALRMGLHRKYKGNFDPVEAETRKRVFWVVRKMDIYVGAMLGLPQTLSDEDIDQEFPTEVDDEYVTKDGILPMPEGQISYMTAFNAHTRLVQLLQKIVRYIYPIKVQDKETGGGDQSYSVPFSAIREIESDLEQWKNDLPPILSLNPSSTAERLTRVQQLLRLSYAHAQVMLYRPFLHFVAMGKRAKPVDQRAYACAASYVNVSRNIIHIQTQMKQRGLLNGAFWFVMYTSFFAVLSLVYFAAENQDNPTTQAIMKDALEGKEVLASLSKRSHAADRCTATLDVVFKKLPEWMRNGQQNPSMGRKRHYGSGDLTSHLQKPAASRSHPDVSIVSHSEPPVPGLQRRSGTFPKISAPKPKVGSPASHDTWSLSGMSSVGPQTPTSTEYPASGYTNFAPRSMSGVAQGLQQYSLPQSTFPNPAISDLSTMMFPAPDEPFGYPNQPLTTFENNQQFAKDNAYGSGHPYSSVDNAAQVMATLPRSGHEDNLEAQYYALPPYIGRQDFQGLMSGEVGGLGHGPAVGAPTSPSSLLNGWSGHQASVQQVGEFSNINIQDIFGGTEWNPLWGHAFLPQ